MIQLSGGQAIVKMLENLGIEVAFGVPGFQALPYYMAIADSRSMRHILVRNEQAGAFAADAYYRSSGKVAVCDATCGPGATNLVTGLAESYHASIPVLAVISNVVSTNAGRGANMEASQDEALRLFAKDCVMIRDVARVPELVRKAFHTAVEGKAGPVVIDMPENIYYDTHAFEEDEFVVYDRNQSPNNRFVPEPDRLEEACRILREAKAPVMLCGGGVHNSNARAQVQELAELLSMPVATTISGKGVISERHPLSLNLFGRYFRYANDYIQQADVLFVVGCKLAEMATIRWSLVSPGTKIIHLEIDPETISKAYPTQYPLVGDARSSLAQMAGLLRKMGVKPDSQNPVCKKIQESAKQWRESVSDKMDNREKPVNIAHMLSVLQRCAPDNTIMIGDGGFAAHWSSVYWSVNSNDGRHYIANRGQASIGYGLPGAVGAKVGSPDKPVIALSGDGGLAYSIMELETCVREKIPVILVVVNNKCLGYVKALEHFQFGKYISVDLTDVRYAEMAKLIGCYGVRVEDPADLEQEFRDALSRDGQPTVIEVMVTTDPAQMLPGKDNRLKNQN